MKKSFLIIFIILLICIIAGYYFGKKQFNNRQKSEKFMAKELQIDLREGFNGENLLIYVDNMQVYNKPTGTNRLTGFAAEVKTPVDKEEVEIKVEMPDQKISKTEKLNMTNGSFVGISFSGNVLEFKQQAKPFGYD